MENTFTVKLNEKVVVEIGGRSITEYVVSVVGSEKGEGDTIELRSGSRIIIISKK